MADYNYQEYSDHLNSLERIQKVYNSIQTELIDIGIRHKIKLSRKNDHNRIYSLRNSLLDRLDSVIFHHEILYQIHSSNNQITENHFSPRISMDISRKQTYIFDSIIFNLVSSFDYVACLINFYLAKNKDKWKLTWNKLERKIRNEEKYKPFKISQNILDSNHNWASKLIDYRADLIHYEGQNSGYSHTVYPNKNLTNIKIYAPLKFRKRFKVFLKKVEKENLDIGSVSLWTIETSFNEIYSLIKSLENHIDNPAEDLTPIEIFE